MSRTPRIGITETPTVKLFLSQIWRQYPELTGEKSETILFALSRVATGNTSSPVPASATSIDSSDVASAFDNVDDLD